MLGLKMDWFYSQEIMKDKSFLPSHFALFDPPQGQIFKVSYYLKPIRGTSPTTKKNAQTNNLVYQCDLCALVSVQ